jgi:hypothetical protein
MRSSKMDRGRNEEMTTMMMMFNTMLRLEEDKTDDQSDGLLRLTEDEIDDQDEAVPGSWMKMTKTWPLRVAEVNTDAKISLL